jgi:hypothetical protein
LIENFVWRFWIIVDTKSEFVPVIIKITQDRVKRKLWLSEDKYLEKVLGRFDMGKYKPITTSLVGHFRLSNDSWPKSDMKKEEMKKVLHAPIMGSLMYVMICTQLDIAHVCLCGEQINL